MVGGHETGEALRIHAPVAVRDDLERNVVDPRQSGGRPAFQARQFPAVSLRQVTLGGADLLFDQVKVIEKPFPGGRNLAVGGDRLRHQSVHADQDRLIFGEPSQQLVGEPFDGQFVLGG